jgi:hypothetical protein
MTNAYQNMAVQDMSERICVRSKNFRDVIVHLLPHFETQKQAYECIASILPLWTPLSHGAESYENFVFDMHTNFLNKWKQIRSFEIFGWAKDMGNFLNKHYLLTYENMSLVVRDKSLYCYLFAGEPITWKGYLPILRKTLKQVKKMPDFRFTKLGWTEIEPIVWF